MRYSIIAGARALFGDRGFQKTTMNEIAANIQASPANLYNYFPSKKAIGFAVASQYLAEEEALLRALEADPPEDAEEHLRQHMRLRVKHLAEHLRAKPLLVELAIMIQEEDEGAQLVDCVIARSCSDLERIVARGAERGDFASQDPAIAAEAIHLSTRYFFAPRELLRRGLRTAEADLERVLDLLIAGLRGGPVARATRERAAKCAD